MLILDLPPALEQTLIIQAQSAGLDINEFVISQLTQINTTPKKERTLGGGEQYFVSMADDFDEPLDDWQDYM